MIFEKVIGGSLLNAFDRHEFAECSGDHDDWNVEALSAENLDSIEAVPARKAVISEDYFVCVRADALGELLGGLDNFALDLNAAGFQRVQDKLNVGRIVLKTRTRNLRAATLT